MSEPSADYDCTDTSNTEAPKPMNSHPDDDDIFHRSNSAGSTARHIELTQRTGELLSDYSNFLRELDDGSARSRGDDEGEFGPSTGLQTPRGSAHSASTARADNLSLRQGYYDERDDNHVSYEPSDPNETNLWNTNHREYYDYDADRKKLYRYRRFRTNNMVYVCGLGVVVALVVIAGISISKSKGRERPPPTTATVSREEPSPSKSAADILANMDTSYMPDDPDLKELYAAVTALFQPQWYDRSTGWNGQAYLAAYQFCNSQNEKMQPCPYTAICPAGAGHVPFGGAREGASGGNSIAWVPIKNEPNEWVQVSLPSNTGERVQDGEICQLFSTTHHGEAPEWGLTGEYNEELTRNIVCCLIDEEVMMEEPEVFTNVVDEANEEMGSDLLDRPPSLEEDEGNGGGGMKMDSDISQEVIADTMTAQQTAGKEEIPVPKDSDIPAYWYSRSDDWQGTTYVEAEQFCSSQNDKSICPYQLYCPNGPGGTPYGTPYEGALKSLLEYDSLFWSPVLNNAGEEAWAGVGMTNQCVPPLNKPRASPEMLWNATSFIMCCDMTYGYLKPSSSAAVEETSSNSENQQNNSDEEVSDNSIAEPSPDMFMQAVKDVWDPVWFSSSKGWNGGSYIEALDFCENNIPGGELCPYQAICPNGIAANPYMIEEVTALAKDQWIPTRAGAYSYLLVSRAQGASGGGEVCNSYESIYSEKPNFGTNDENNDQKQYLLCCHHYDEDGDEGRRA